jgi:hypothetical protein
MSDMLIRDVDPQMQSEIEARARESDQTLSDEVKGLLRWALEQKPRKRIEIPPGKLGTYLFSLLEDEFRGDDLVFEVDDIPAPPPDFE